MKQKAFLLALQKLCVKYDATIIGDIDLHDGKIRFYNARIYPTFEDSKIGENFVFNENLLIGEYRDPKMKLTVNPAVIEEIS